MRIVFIGARVVGYRCLEAMLQAGFDVVGLLTLDSSKASITTSYTRFDPLVEKYHLPTHRFTDVNDSHLLPWIKNLKPQLGIVIGLSQLLSRELLAIPEQGFLGMHPTLLPQGRGRAPIPWAIIKGLKQTGVSLFICNETADSGDMLAQQAVPIYYEDTGATLGARSDDVAIELLTDCIKSLENGTITAVPQDISKASYWQQRRPDDGDINWSLNCRTLYDWIRALTHPYPGAFTTFNKRRLWVWAARESCDERQGQAGEILAIFPYGLLVATGQGNLLITRVQWEQEEEIAAAHAELRVGDVLGN